jgi:hypothetical protein
MDANLTCLLGGQKGETTLSNELRRLYNVLPHRAIPIQPGAPPVLMGWDPSFNLPICKRRRPPRSPVRSLSPVEKDPHRPFYGVGQATIMQLSEASTSRTIP